MKDETIINTQRLILHQWNQDVQITSMLYLLFANKFLLQYTDLPVVNMSESLYPVYSFLNQGQRITWFLKTKSDSLFIGLVSCYFNFKHKTVVLTFVLLPEFEKNGFMNECLHEIHSNIFDNYDIYRIEAQVYTENIKSINVLKKTGYLQEGILRNNFMIQGKLRNSYMYSLLKSEWNKNRMTMI